MTDFVAFTFVVLPSTRPSRRAISPAQSQRLIKPRMTVSMVATPVKEPVTKKQVSTSRQTKQPDMYRLYIYNDPFNKRERVVDVLLKTCQGLTFSRAYAAMQEAHENGRGLVVIVFKEIAEHYCATINSAGILSTIEPDK